MCQTDRREMLDWNGLILFILFVLWWTLGVDALTYTKWWLFISSQVLWVSEVTPFIKTQTNGSASHQTMSGAPIIFQMGRPGDNFLLDNPWGDQKRDTLVLGILVERVHKKGD